MRISCPKCNTAYSVDSSKIKLNGRKKSAQCIKCGSRFYVQVRKTGQKGNKQSSNIYFLHSYFEKRDHFDRRKGNERRKKIRKEELSFIIPDKDLIPIFNDEGLSVGCINNGRREGRDRRSGSDRRIFITN